MTAFIFPGQGIQKLGIGKDLFTRHRALVTVANEILGYSLDRLCLEGPIDQLSQTRYCQPAIFVVNALAYLEEIERTGAPPAIVLGHSLGEYNALFASGVFDFATGVGIVKRRAELMSTARGGAMAAVIGLDRDALEGVLRRELGNAVTIAAYNSPVQLAVSGDRRVISNARSTLLAAGATAYTVLNVSAAFHSHAFDEQSRAFEEYLSQIEYRPFQIPVIGNVTGGFYESPAQLPHLLSEQLRRPVRWEESVQTALETGCRSFIEIGGTRALAPLIDEIRRSTPDPDAPARRPAGKLAASVTSLVDLVRTRADERADAPLYRFLRFRNAASGEDLPDEELLTYSGLQARARAIAAHLQEHGSQGERVLILLESGIGYITAYFGCLFAGAIPVPSYPPTSAALKMNVRCVLASCEAKFILTSSRTSAAIAGEIASQGPLPRVINLDTIATQDGASYQDVLLTPDSLAMLQYTSGSTGRPRGVMVSHGNLIANCAAIKATFGLTPRARGVSWLPPFHDMGLIGLIIQPLYTGYEVVMMSPMAFLAKPHRWLQAISTYGASVSGGPNFAYELSARKVTTEQKLGLDLTSWETAFNGAEPVHAETLERFAARFEICGFKRRAFAPCYGLAENTLLVSGARHGYSLLAVDRTALSHGRVEIPKEAAGKHQALVGCGGVAAGQELAIVDPQTAQACSDGAVGEIWVAGPCAAKGYWNDDAATEKTFRAYTTDGRGPYLRTGDLGFVDSGQLFITGRTKDVVIIRGRNYYPQDIEAAVASGDTSIRAGRVVAFSDSDPSGDSLVIVAERRSLLEEQVGEVIAAIRQRVSENLGIAVRRVVLVKPSSLPMTTSGKPRRREVAKLLADGQLPIIADHHPAHDAPGAPVRRGEAGANAPGGAHARAVETLQRIAGSVLGVDSGQVRPDRPLGMYGLDSLRAVELSVQIETAFSCSFAPPRLFECPTLDDVANALVGSSAESAADDQPCRMTQQDRDEPFAIAVVGMHGVFPGCASAHQLWRNLIAGRSLVTATPAGRSALSGSGDGGVTMHGGFVEGMMSFDASFFGLTEGEALVMDPQQRKMLEVVWRAIEDAGYSPEIMPRDTGVFMGASTSDYRELIISSGVRLDGHSVTGLANALIANRVSYLFDFGGPSETIDTACSSSLAAIHRAVLALRSGECSAAVVGGANAILAATSSTALKNAGFLSRDGKCKTFDSSADGYVRGEGCIALVLKRLQDAERDGDAIHGVIKGSWVNHGGRSASLTAPNANAQARLLRGAYAAAGWDPRLVSYIEMHGTGTALGDPIEVRGLRGGLKLMGASAADGDAPTGWRCGIGSVKTNIGHLEAAAGMAGLVKVLLAFRYGTLPPSINLDKMNPYIELDGSPFHVIDKATPWTSDGARPRRAGVSSFGFGGSNYHLLVEEYAEPEPTRDPSACGPDEPQVVVFSARDRSSLREILAEFLDVLTWDIEHGIAHDLRRIARTLQSGREHFTERVAFVASSLDELLSTMERHLAGLPARGDDVIVGHGACELDVPPIDIESMMSDGGLRRIATSWAMGGNLDWGIVRGAPRSGRCHLPGYAFARREYLPEAMNSDRVPRTAPDAADRELSEEAIERFLVREVARQCGLRDDEVRRDISFYDLGMESLGIVSMHSKLADHLGRELGPSAIYGCPTISSLAAHAASGAKDCYVDLSEELALAPDLVPDATVAQPTDGRDLLLTGATGFVGSYLLCELLRRSSATIHCLVRGATAEEALARLGDACAKHGISSSEMAWQRISVVLGDVSQPLLGLTPSVYDRLSRTVGTIYHGAALVDWMKPYAVLRNTNVTGTIEVIRLACTGIAKRIHFISSLSAISAPNVVHDNPDNELQEDYISNPHGITSGYGQTKWVCEQLIKRAIQRGVTATIYRFDFAIGSAATGVMNHADFLVRLVQSVIQLRCIPREEVYFNVIAVDHLCRAIAAISGDAGNGNQIFHILNPAPLGVSALAALIANYGYDLHTVSLELWKKLIIARKDNALYFLHPFISQYRVTEFGRYMMARVARANTIAALDRADPGIYRSIPKPLETMHAVMTYLIDREVVPAAASLDTFNPELFLWEQDAEPRARSCLTNQVCFDLHGVQGRLASLCASLAVSELDFYASVVAIMSSRYELASGCTIAIPVAAACGAATVLHLGADLSGNPSFDTVIRRVHREVQRRLEDIDRTRPRVPLGHDDRRFSRVLLSYHGDLSHTCACGQSVSADHDAASVRSSLFFRIAPDGDRVRVSVGYDTHQFQSATVERIARHFVRISTRVLDDSSVSTLHLQKQV